MDSLFKRYASPFLLIDNILLANRFDDFVKSSYEAMNDDKYWDLYLHKVFDKSFNDFMKTIKTKPNQKATQDELKATVKNTKNILDSFKPQLDRR